MASSKPKAKKERAMLPASTRRPDSHPIRTGSTFVLNGATWTALEKLGEGANSMWRSKCVGHACCADVMGEGVDFRV